MSARIVVWIFFLCRAILARSIPQHNIQELLLPEVHRTEDYSRATSVILEFTESGSNEEKRYEIPLRFRTLAGMSIPCVRTPKPVLMVGVGTNLPKYPKNMKMVAVVNEQGRSVPLERLEQIICQVEPGLDAEERAAAAVRTPQSSWPWFSARDEVIQFEDKDSRWFLGGRAVKNYECR